MKKIVLSILSIIFILSMFLISCEEEGTFDPDTVTAEDNARAEGVFGDIFALTSNNTSEEGGGKALLGDSTDCFDVDIVIDTVAGTRTMTLTFDEAGCDLGDGVIRKGQIIAVYEPNWFSGAGKTVTTTFNEFSRDNNVVNGTIEIVFLRLDGLKPVHKITATDMSITLEDGKTIAWSGERTIKWLNGFLTRRNRKDDILEINSEITGTNRNGEAYTSLGVNVVKDYTCEYKMPVSGTINITKGTDIMSVDFGNGDCDCEYVLTQNGVSVTLTPCGN